MPTCQYDVTSEDYWDFILSSNTSLSGVINERDIVCRDYANEVYSVIYVRAGDNQDFAPFPFTTIPNLYTLLDSSNMQASGISETLTQPYLNTRGQGTLIGFIDTGIDYTNPLFQNPDGTTRVAGIWDQTLNGSRDNGQLMQYGTEFTEEQINEALSAEDPLELVPSIDENGHGTFAAGIAAGNQDPDRDFTGAAPECSIGVVKLKPAKQSLRDFYLIQDSAIAYQENDIMMGVRYLMGLALQKSRPLVIYIGLGTNYGSHEGTSPLCLMLRNVNHLVGVAAVIAGGNEAGLGHHYLGQVSRNKDYEDVELNVSEDENGFMVQVWASAPEVYSVGFISPLGQIIQRIPVNLETSTLITFTLEETQITIYYGLAEYDSGSEFISIRFKNPTPGIWVIRVYNTLLITGAFHLWLPVDGFITGETRFLSPTPYTIITEPGNTYTPITVGAYNHNNNSIYLRSSRGYNRVDVVKPDLVAPGVNIDGPGRTPAAQGGEYPMVKSSGTSVAAAHVAGAAADLMTWGIVNGNRPNMTAAIIKSLLTRGADRNPAYEFPNREWGYGSLNLYQTFFRLMD